MNGYIDKSALGEYANMGFTMQEVVDDCIEIYLKESRIAVLPPTATKRIIQKVCFDVVWGIKFLFEAETRLLPSFSFFPPFLEIGGASVGEAGSARPIMEGK